MHQDKPAANKKYSAFGKSTKYENDSNKEA